MYKNNRRDFLVKMGLVSGSVLIGGRGLGAEIERSARFSLQTDLNAVHFHFTGNLKGARLQSANLPNAVAPHEALWLDSGNFVTKTGDHYRIVQEMNRRGYQASAVGPHEWSLGKEKLLELAKQCQFTLVMSHGNSNLKNWTTWIKPYEIIHIGGRKIGIVAMGPLLSTTDMEQDFAQVTKQAQYLKEEKGCTMSICLIPAGYSLDAIKNWAQYSTNIDLLACGAVEENTVGNRILKNSVGNDVTLMLAAMSGELINRYVASFAHSEWVLPHNLTSHFKEQRLAGSFNLLNHQHKI